MSCLLCPAGAESCRWCNPPARSPDGRFSGTTATQQRRVLLGLHPMGHPMPAEGAPACSETCKSCANLRRNVWTKTYLKCALCPSTGGLGSDTRAKWPACARWRSPAAEEADQRAEVEAGRGP